MTAHGHESHDRASHVTEGKIGYVSETKRFKTTSYLVGSIVLSDLLAEKKYSLVSLDLFVQSRVQGISHGQSRTGLRAHAKAANQTGAVGRGGLEQGLEAVLARQSRGHVTV